MNIIKDDEEHAIALEKIFDLLNLQELDEELKKEIDLLVDAVVVYETVGWPMGEANEQYTE